MTLRAFLGLLLLPSLWPSGAAAAVNCRECVMLWQLPRIKSGREFQQLNQASGANHTELVLLTNHTSANLAGVRYVFSVDTLIGAEEDVWPILYLGRYPERLAVEEGVTLTLFGLVVQNVNATLTFADSGDGGDGGTTGSSSTSSGGADASSGWSLSLSSFKLSSGSLLRLVRCEVVLADCSVARRLFQLADPGTPGAGQGDGTRGQQLAGVEMVQVINPEVYVTSWISDQLELVDVRVTCSEVCDAASGVRTLPVSSAAALREAMFIVDAHLDGCSAYVIELAGNVSLADAVGLPPLSYEPSVLLSNPPPPPQSQQDSRTTRRLLHDGHWATAGGLRYGGRTSRASLAYEAHGSVRLGLGRGRRLRSLSTAAGFNGTARVVVDLTIRGSAFTSAAAAASSPPIVVLDMSLLSYVFVVQFPARLVLERLTLINLVSPQPGVLALPMYFVGAESGDGGAGGGGVRPTVGNTTRIVLRNATLVLAQDEVSYVSTWFHDVHDSPWMLSADQVAWLQEAVQEATVQSFQMDALTFTRLHAWDIDASDLHITSTPPSGYSLSHQPTIGIAFFAATPLQPYPQIVTLLSSGSTAAAASLAYLLNASAQPLLSQPGAYVASPGVPTLAAVNLPSGGSNNGSYAPVPYGAVTLQRSYTLGPLINASTGALAYGATTLPVLDLGHTRATWASFGRPGLRLALRNLTLVGLDSPGRWPADRLVRCLDLPMWALDVARRPSLSGEAPALELSGTTVSVSPQELQLWAACYESLSAEATGEDEVALLDACRSLGLQVLKITRLGDHALQVDLLQGMGIMIRNSVLRDDLFPYFRYDIEELLPGATTSGDGGDGEGLSSHTKKWIILVVVIGILVLVVIAVLLYIYVRHKRRGDKPKSYINIHMMKMMASGTGIRPYAQDSLNSAQRARSTRQGAGDCSGGTIPRVSAVEDSGTNTGPGAGPRLSPGRGPGPNADPKPVEMQTAGPKPAENGAGAGAGPGGGQRDAAASEDLASAYGGIGGGGGGEPGLAFLPPFDAGAAALGWPDHWAAAGMAYSAEPYMGGYGTYMEQHTGATVTPMYGAMLPGGDMTMPGYYGWEYGVHAGLAGRGWLAGGMAEDGGVMQQAEVPGVEAQEQATAGAASGAAAACDAAPTQAGGVPLEEVLAVRQAAKMQLTPTAAPPAQAPPPAGGLLQVPHSAQPSNASTRRSPFQATSSCSRLSETAAGRSDSSSSLTSRAAATSSGSFSGRGGGGPPAAVNVVNAPAGPPAGGSTTSGPVTTLGGAGAAATSDRWGTAPYGGSSGKARVGKLLVGSLSNMFRVDSLTVGTQHPASPLPALLASASSIAAPPERAGRVAAVQLAEVGWAGTPLPAAAALPAPGQRRLATAAVPGAVAATAAAGGGRASGQASVGGGSGSSRGGGVGGGAALGLEAALNELTANVESRLNENQLVIQQVLGSGAFGTVYKALWKGLQVAVKTMTLTADAVTQGRHAALMEAALSKSIFHPNVVTTYTCDLKPMHVDSRRGGAMTGLHIMNETEVIQEWRLYIVQEFCDGGSLRQAIEARSFLNPASGAPQMEWVLQMAREVAGGLQYLHEHNIIHGDLNPANVLLKRDDNSMLGYAAKIADFGLSVHMRAEQSHVSNTKRGTPFYTAPEVTHAGNLTRFADVFSYGVVLWELYCSRSCWTYGPQGRLVQRRGFPHLPSTCPRAFAQLVSSCMQPAHKQRPTFKQIGIMMESMQRELEYAAAAAVAPVSRIHSQGRGGGWACADGWVSGGPPAHRPPGGPPAGPLLPPAPQQPPRQLSPPSQEQQQPWAQPQPPPHGVSTHSSASGGSGAAQAMDGICGGGGPLDSVRGGSPVPYERRTATSVVIERSSSGNTSVAFSGGALASSSAASSAFAADAGRLPAGGGAYAYAAGAVAAAAAAAAAATAGGTPSRTGSCSTGGFDVRSGEAALATVAASPLGPSRALSPPLSRFSYAASDVSAPSPPLRM